MARRREQRAGRRAARFALGLAALLVAATVLPVACLRFLAPPTTAFMLRSRSGEPASGRACDPVEYAWVDGARIAPALALAVVVAEDQRFLDHRGFDWPGLRRAFREWREGTRARGASTLSQQLAKNLFLWPGPSLLRKAIEAWLTFWIEALWPKGRILEVYLNVVQFGPCTFGAEAASRRFFERDAGSLDPDQAALLATVLPNPHRLRAHDPGPYAQERSREVLALMEEHAWLARRLRGPGPGGGRP